MNKRLSKLLMVLLAVIITLSSVPVSSISQIASDRSIGVVAEAASKKTHLNKTKKSVYIGEKYTLKLIDKNGKTISSSKVKWSRSNKKVASVSKKGVVTGKKAGKIKITAKYKGKKYTAVITVKSAVSVNKSKVTFKAGETAKKTIKVTCKDDKGIKWKTVEGSGIVKLSQAKKWKNDSKSLYITPTGTKFGTVKIKIYSKENSNSYDYLTIDVKKPYTLKTKTSIPCIINNYESEENMKNPVGDSALIIRKVTYKTPNTKTINVTVEFEAGYSERIESYYFIKYRVLDKKGYLVESDVVKSKLMMAGDKAKAEITLKNLKNGDYTIEFRDYVGNDISANVTPGTTEPPVDDNSMTTTPDATPTPDTTTPSMITADEALAMYQKNAKLIHEKGIAGYSKKGWQIVESFNTNNTSIKDILQNLIQGFLTKEEDAEVKVNAKGSEDAMRRMPISDCSKGMVKSTSVKKLSNGNYNVVIVLKDQVNPSYDDSDGIAVMSRDFLDYAYLKNELENTSVVRSFEGEIKYSGYTITAEMTKDGKFVSITHKGIGYMEGNINSMAGSIVTNAEIEFNAKYYDFKY